ncbi:MAG: alpha-N-acetylglucosaminidase [Prevotella sp.]|jgi:alpha-N-acetylglucosaminidase|nr:alpha-N-acetylglucosaminidase [Prevotella sp.]
MKRIQAFIVLLYMCSLAFAGPVDSLLERIGGKTSKNILTEIVPQNGKDYFEVSNQNGKLRIKGNNPISIATGFNWYLKYTAGVHIAWNNLNQSLPSNLPLPEKTIRQETDLHLRYYLNYCTFSYSMAFWDWERWEKEIDWMAMHGINLSLSITGNEVVWYNLLKRLGYTTDEINGFVSGPAFMAWWQMNNLEGWGGPNPDEWYKNQEILQKKIVTRMRALGIEPVLPGFAGMVPRNIGEKLGYSISDPGTWCSFDRPAFLNPNDPNFDKFADMYYEEMEKLYGKAKYYAIDPFHEGGSTKGINLDAAGKTIMAAMKRANHEAVWVAQAWQANPRPTMIENLNAHDLLVLDLYSEKKPQWGDSDSEWYRPQGYGKHNWLYCMLLNFGGRVGLHGRMDSVIDGFYKAGQHPNGKTLSGVGTTPEGIENNPVMFELLYELPWRKEKFTKEEWLKTYIKARYRMFDETVYESWLLLAQYPYNCPAGYPGEGTVESLFCARPGINLKRVSTWGSSILYYNSDYTRQAAEKLLSVAHKLRDNANFQYDLVDILRQSIADKGNDLSGEIGKAYKDKDIEKFKTLSDSFLLAIQCQDRLLATQKDFTVGNWLEQAKSLSQIDKNKDLYEWNARTLITVWGNKAASEQGGLHDYSSREWNGILSGLYYKRWKLFFDNTVKEMQGETVSPVDFFAMEEAWTHEKKTYANKPEGDVVQTATEVYKQVFGD